MQGAPQQPVETDGSIATSLPSGRNLAGTSWGSQLFTSSFRGNRPHPLPEPLRSQVSASGTNANSAHEVEDGRPVETYLGRATARMGRKPGTSLTTFSDAPNGRSFTTVARQNNNSFSRRYPLICSNDDLLGGAVTGPVANDSFNRNEEGFKGLLAKVPQTVWQPNAVARQHRRMANVYWVLLLMGYIAYIILAICDSLQRRHSPPVMLKHVHEPFKLPDVGFCFEGDMYGSRFGCFDGDADGKDCADSLIGDVFVYGYNRTGYQTPNGYNDSKDHIVLLPNIFSDTCVRFQLSTLTAKESDVASSWRFHMLMFWNSFYDSVTDAGAFESTKMYLYREGLTAQEVIQTPISLYPPISFDPAEVPFVRGFLEYERHLFLNGDVSHEYKVVDTTTAPWHNAEDAISLAAQYRTDTLASIQLDIRTQSFYQFSEVDPLDIAGTLGEITGFWLVVPLLFGLLFYRPEKREDDDQATMRSFSSCSRHRGAPVAPPQAS